MIINEGQALFGIKDSLGLDIFVCDVDDQNKTKMLGFRVSQAELNLLRRAAVLARRKVADYCRVAVLEKIERDMGGERGEPKATAKKKH